MVKNEVFEIEITGMTDEGDGVGRAEGKAVFVPYTIIGETVRIIIVKVLKNYAFGKILDIIKPSEARLKAECKYFYKCGGCQLWHMNIEKELEYKRQKVTDCLKRIGGLDIEAEPVLCPSSRTRYRNKAQFPVTPEGIGFYRRNSHDVIPIDDCIIQDERDKAVTEAVAEWKNKYGISAYNEADDSGDLRHIYTRSGKNGVLITLVTRTSKLPNKAELIKTLTGLDVKIAGIVQNINDCRTNVVLGRKNITLWGDSCLIDSIGNVKFKISPMSFYQINPKSTLKLYELVEEMANLTGKEVLWDLYCGIGTIGLFLAKKAKKVIGIEIVPDAIENARENARLNDIDNAEFYCGKAEKLAGRLSKNCGRPDVVILDPPRKGCDIELLKAVAAAKPKRVIYVSCKPSTLARDLKIMREFGYETLRAVPVNMFPSSYHVETAVLLSEKYFI